MKVTIFKVKFFVHFISPIAIHRNFVSGQKIWVSSRLYCKIILLKKKEGEDLQTKFSV